jgi:hypothetical protein
MACVADLAEVGLRSLSLSCNRPRNPEIQPN